jgi:hypothetical protein
MRDMTPEDAKRLFDNPNDKYTDDINAIRWMIADLLNRVTALEKPEHKTIKGKQK